MFAKVETTTCPMCNRIAIKLVPLYDHDQKHELQMCCVHCKRAIKAGKEIIKFKGRENAIKQLQEELLKKSKKRQVIAPV